MSKRIPERVSHQCKPLPFMYQTPHVTRVPNLLRGHMYTQPCACGALLPIEWPLGSKARGRLTGAERWLAEAVPGMHELYGTDPKFRDEEIDRLAEFVAAVYP